LAFLTQLFNLSILHADIPAIWKSALIVPILKPGKPADQGSSYRPISLPNPAAKILERLLHPEFVAALPKTKSHHGYAPMHSCVTALLPFATQVAVGFNNNKPARRSALVAWDISKAFDSVDHTILLEEVSNSPLQSNYVCWLAAYLSGRTASVVYNGATSPPRIICSGTPQGSVLSPDIWNFFVLDCPVQAEVQEAYADDLGLLESDVNTDVTTGRLIEDVAAVAVWAKRKNLVLAPNKSHITLFTLWTK
jgi:hypothetical protein